MDDDLEAWQLHDDFTIHQAASLAVGIQPDSWYDSDMLPLSYSSTKEAMIKAIDTYALVVYIPEPFDRPWTFEQYRRNPFSKEIHANYSAEKASVKKVDLIEWFMRRGVTVHVITQRRR